MLYRMEGIVIRGTDYGEGNKIITIFTPSHGKQGIVVKGARKPKSRYASLAQLFTYGDFSFYKSGNLGSLNAGEILESYRELRENLDRSAYAAYAAEMCDRVVGEEDASGYLFHQFKACLTALAEGKDPAIVIRIFEMKVVHAVGYAPMLDECAACGRTEGGFRFSAHLGGAICERCRHQDPGALELAPQTWKLLRIFSRIDLRQLGQIDVKPAIKAQLKTAMRRWMDHHLGMKLKSVHFLDQWEKLDELPLPVRRSPPGGQEEQSE
ncbi:DNA repair protein RecO [Cohnella thailandensis]|uniref:DNA repair protein RecO n=1 Tax=Cohnella thailandensis TaxID=557557 RepID=A0A841T038_9BACL|nr:DNA repair protein RecO [Cohnella thailandensis]MBB6636236.1 DNA repair protein RecO [Cohnella thailandensis]MBP1973795.1 DNA repair protein RecO (recombination protein O) [Cohnella thailandensis]